LKMVKVVINALSADELDQLTVSELGESPQKMQKDLQLLRDWIKQSPHLQNIKTDEMLLKTFLRGCKYSIERTKEKLDFFFSCRGNLPEWFSGWDPVSPGINACLTAGTIVPLQGYDREGRYTVLVRPGLIPPAKLPLNDLIKTQLMMMEFAMRDNVQAAVKGLVIIQDMSAMTAAHVTQITIPLMKKLTTLMQEAFPEKPKAFHMLNMPSVMESIHNLSKTFLKEKMQRRQHVHPKGDLSKLKEMVGPDILPEEYGGTNGTVAQHVDFWKSEAERNKDWFVQQTMYKTDESRRPGKPRLHADLFGIEGSFRKLEID